MSTKAFLTGEDLWRIVANGSRYELSQGKLIPMTPVGIRHAVVVSKLTRVVGDFVASKRLGILGPEGGFYLRRNPDTLRAPDLAFVSNERLKQTGIPEKFADFPPDLAIEVLSSEDTASEIQRKVGEYLEAGVPLVWIVDPANQNVTVYRSLHEVQVLSAPEELDGGEVLPGFKAPVAELFRI